MRRNKSEREKPPPDAAISDPFEQRLLKAIIEGQESAQRRIAWNLHRSLGNQLAALKFMIGTILKQVSDPSLHLKLQEVNRLLIKATGEIRTAYFNLMPKTLNEQGLYEAIGELCHYASQYGNVLISIKRLYSLPRLPPDLETDVFRIVQELITNAIQHGNASLIDMDFHCSVGKISIKVTDNGSGFEPQLIRQDTTGIKNVRIRVQAHRGYLKLSSRPGKGTTAFIILPIH